MAVRMTGAQVHLPAWCTKALHRQVSCSMTPGLHRGPSSGGPRLHAVTVGLERPQLLQVVHLRGPGRKPQACTLVVQVAALQLTCTGHVCLHRPLGRLDSRGQGVVYDVDALPVAGDHHAHTEGGAHLLAGSWTETQAMPDALVPDSMQAQALCATRTPWPAAG